MLGMLRHQLAAELQRVHAGRLGQLVHEAFEVDGVLVDVDAAPEARRHVRIAHGVVDQQVRHGVAERRLAGRRKALERGGVHAVHQGFRAQCGQDRLAGDADVQRRQVALVVEAAGQPALRDRMIGAVLHVLFARPHQLDRRARHLLGDQHRLGDVVRAAAPAEAAAQHDLVDLALAGRQAGGFQRRGERRLAVLRAAPHLALVGRVERGGVHRLHAGVVLVGIGVDRLDLLGRAGKRGLGVAVLVADEGLLGVEAFLQPLGDRFARHFGVVAFVPDDRQRVERGLGVPPGVGDDGDGVVADLHHLLDALHRLRPWRRRSSSPCRRTPGRP